MTPMTLCSKVPRLLMTLVLPAALLGGCWGGGDEQKFIASGKAQLQQHNDAGAIIEFKNALQKQPDNAEARYLLGTALRSTGNLAAAEIELRKALAAGYEADTVRAAIVGLLIDMGQAQKALDEIGKAGADDTAIPAGLLALKGDALLGLGRTEDARAVYDAALAKDPQNATGMLGRARMAAIAGDSARAESLVDEVVKVHPDFLNGWLMKANLLVQGGRIPDAIAAYDRAIAIRPGDFRIYTGLIPALLVTRNVDTASRRVAELKKLAPAAPVTAYLDALMSYTKGDKLHARDAIGLVLKVAPDDMRALMLAGTIEHDLGNDSLAVKYLTRVVAAAPAEEQSRRLLASSYLRLGNVEKAEELARPLLEAPSVSPQVHELAGEIAFARRDLSASVSQYEQAVKGDPGNASLRLRLAQARLATGDTDRGVAELEAASTADPGNAAADLALVTFHLARGDVDRAQAAATVLARKLPAAPATPFAQGLVLLARKDVAQARTAFEKAVTIDPAYLPAARQLAVLDEQDHKPSAAVARFQAVLKADPNQYEAALLLAEALQRARSPAADVVAALDSAIAMAPSNPRPQLAKIEYLTKSGNDKDALTAAQNAQATLPDDRTVLYALARAQQRVGDHAQALATFGKLASLAPEWEIPQLGLASVHAAEGNWSAARTAAQRAVELKPGSVPAHLSLVDIGLRAGQLEQALADAQAIQQKWPSTAAGYAASAQVYMAMKKPGDAERVLRSGLAKTGSVDLVNRLYALTLSQGRGEAADREQLAWVARHPSDVRALMFAGDARLAAGQYREAERWYRKAVAVQPQNAIVLNNLAWVLGKLGDPSAVTIGQQALARVPDSPVVMDTLGSLYVQFGQVDEGIAQLRKAAELAPKAVTVRINLARGLIKSGDKSGARRYLDEADGLNPNDTARKEIAELRATL
ncbi:MAG: PEP-CTERM system TPR-repeat protein PrsT [Betaproteobacteria bacterium]|nr:PEP-CTERM system TPR-repeat protein PrsT [Betaproteobacteria bacterium]